MQDYQCSACGESLVEPCMQCSKCKEWLCYHYWGKPDTDGNDVCYLCEGTEQ